MKIIAILSFVALLTSCTCTFRGSFLNVDEFHFGPIPHEHTPGEKNATS